MKLSMVLSLIIICVVVMIWKKNPCKTFGVIPLFLFYFVHTNLWAILHRNYWSEINET